MQYVYMYVYICSKLTILNESLISMNLLKLFVIYSCYIMHFSYKYIIIVLEYFLNYHILSLL